MTFTALVPVSRLEGAKGRLSDVLTPAQRAELTITTLTTVLEAVVGAGGRPIVLTGDDRVMRMVGVAYQVMPEQGGSGLTVELEDAIDQLDDPELLILHADLPLVSSDDIAALIEQATPEPSVAMVESADGGTNAMLLRPPGMFALAYGKGSARRHREAAERKRMSVRAVDIPGLRLDLDTPADLEELLRCERGRTSAAGKLLRSWGFESEGAGR